MLVPATLGQELIEIEWSVFHAAVQLRESSWSNLHKKPAIDVFHGELWAPRPSPTKDIRSSAKN